MLVSSLICLLHPVSSPNRKPIEITIIIRIINQFIDKLLHQLIINSILSAFWWILKWIQHLIFYMRLIDVHFYRRYVGEIRPLTKWFLLCEEWKRSVFTCQITHSSACVDRPRTEGLTSRWPAFKPNVTRPQVTTGTPCLSLYITISLQLVSKYIRRVSSSFTFQSFAKLSVTKI